MLFPGSGTEQSGQEISKRGDVDPVRDFARLASGFWFSEHAFQAWSLAFGVFGLVIADLLIQVGINRWSRLFFDALERRDTPTVLFGLQLILLLAVAAAASGAAFVQCKMRLQVQWRQWLTQGLISRWLSDRRFYQLSIAGDPAKNPEYRIADDVRMATEPLVDLWLVWRVQFSTQQLLLASFGTLAVRSTCSHTGWPHPYPGSWS